MSFGTAISPGKILRFSGQSCSFITEQPLIRGLPGSSDSKESACNAGDPVQFLGREDPLEKRMATHSSILASRIPWIEEPGELQSIGLQRAGHSWVTNTCTFYSFSKLVSSLTIQQCTDFIISIIMWRWKDNISLKHTPK